MFRILVVEDVRNALLMLKGLLSEEFPEAVIDIASSIVEAQKLLKVAMEEGFPYHAVVLDFKLPLNQEGEDPQIDESLCKYVREVFPWTLIVHMTAFPDDPQIKQHMDHFHKEENDRNAFYVPKGAKSSELLIEKMKKFLYSGLIEEQLDQLFGSNRDPAFTPWGRYLRSGGGRGFSLTNRLAVLLQDIVTYWKDLDISVQNKVRDIYQVDDSTDPIRIRLFRNEPEG